MRITAELNSRERTALIFCLAFMAATLLLTFVDQNSFIHTVRSTIDHNYLQLRYTGTVIIPDQSKGMCPFSQYNNRTKEFRKTEEAEYYTRPNSYSLNSRMD